MATTKTTASKKTDNPEKKRGWRITRQHKMLFGCLLVLFSIALLMAFISHFIHGQEDQSAIYQLADRNVKVNNWLGKFGAFLADLFIYRGFGVASFLFVKLFFLSGAFLVLDISLKKLKSICCLDSSLLRFLNLAEPLDLK